MDGKMGDAIMRYSNILLVAAAIAATACTKEIVSENGNNSQPEVKLYPMTFTAGADDGSASDTKVTLKSQSVLWSSGDQIKVFDDTETSLDAFTIKSGEGTTSATFSGSVANPSANTYYALYPYQESATFHASLVITESATRTNAIKATIPTEQTAVAGSMPSNAFLSMATSDSDGNFSFKNALSLVKFQIKATDKPSDIESISLSGNALEYIAGNVGLYLAGEGVNIDYIRGEAESYVTLTGSFESVKDYFFAIRPVTFKNGITLTVKYKDGSCKYASSANASQALSRNSVLNLGELPLADGLPNDLYIAYLHGHNIKAGSKVINKTNYKGFTTLTATKASDATLRTKIHTQSNDVYLFIDTPETCDFELGSYTTTQSNVVVIGRYQDAPAKIKYSQISKVNSGSLILKNLSITPMDGNRTIDTADATSTISDIIIDGCSVQGLNSNFIYSNKSDYQIQNIEINYCDIVVKSNGIALIKGYATNTYPSITFSQNVVYNPTALETTDNTTFKVFCDNQAKTSTITQMTMNNNTFVNVFANTTYLIYINTIKSATIKNNLWYFPTTITTNGTGYLRAIDGVYSGATVKDNIAFSNSDKAIKFLYKDNIITPNTNTINNTNPFDPYNLSEGVFSQTGDYSTYGAQRTQTGTETLSSRQAWSGASGWTF
ncbi:MAG: hypothetical protein ACI3ZL_08420 [Candidatus Cryptobacteroides sp.]